MGQLKSKPYISIEQIGNKSAISRFIDCRKDDNMSNLQRPGLGAALANLGAEKHVSVFEWVEKSICAAVSGGSLYKVEEDGTSTEITGAAVTGGKRASFASFGQTLYMAAGGKIVSWDGGPTCSVIADADAPTDVVFVAFLDQYLLALDSTGTMHFSDVNSPGTWLGEFFNAESRPDTTIAMMSHYSEITMFGTSSIEYWYDTGELTGPFARIAEANTDIGIIAPYSLTFADNGYWFLTHERRIAVMRGRTPQVVSWPVDEFGENSFQNLGTVSDAFGWYDPKTTTYVLTFPSESVSWAYDIKRDVWSEWTHYKDGRNAFKGQSACYMRAWNKTIVGGDDGKVYILSTGNDNDDGQLIVSEIQWPSQVRAKGQRKAVLNEIDLEFKRGIGGIAPSTEPFAEFSYRKDGKTEWSTGRTINLGQAGETELNRRLVGFGAFRSIEYRTIMSAPGWVLADEAEVIS